MDKGWIDAARAYGAMNENDRRRYWEQLGPAQQQALTQAIAQESAAAAELRVQQSPAAPVRSGCLRTAAIGCTGMLLGSVLTIALEIMAIKAGVDAIGDVFGDMSSSSPQPRAEPSVPDRRAEAPEPQDDDQRSQLVPADADCNHPSSDEIEFFAKLWRNACVQQWEAAHPNQRYPVSDR